MSKKEKSLFIESNYGLRFSVSESDFKRHSSKTKHCAQYTQFKKPLPD